MRIVSRLTSRAQELQAAIAAERSGEPFLLLSDGEGAQRLVILEPEDERVLVGRSSAAGVALEWDDRVSRGHAELVRVGREWGIVDDGLSRNGTWVNGERVVGRRRLGAGDAILVGATTITFHGGEKASGARTSPVEVGAAGVALTPMQRRVLVALCRPLVGRSGGVPATNRAIAAELVLSVEGVKSHLRALFAKFELDDLPQNAKRSRLAELALRLGVVTSREVA